MQVGTDREGGEMAQSRGLDGMRALEMGREVVGGMLSRRGGSGEWQGWGKRREWRGRRQGEATAGPCSERGGRGGMEAL